MERIHPNPPKLDMDFTDDGLTGCAGLAFLAHSARRCGLFRQLSAFAPCKVRRRGASDAENLWSLVSLLAQGCGTLRDLDGLKSDTATCGILGLDRVSGSRRVGEWLHRMDASHVTSLRRISQVVAAQVAPAVISHEVATRGYVPVFLDGTAIEVDGDHFEGAIRSYGERRQYWMHAAFVGRLQVSGRLESGNRDSVGDWRSQLSEDLAPLMGPDTPVWVLMDDAYYRGSLVQWLRDRGWDYSMSVTHPRNKGPIVTRARDMDLWEPLDDTATESACVIRYRPSRWRDEQNYVVVRRDYEGAQKLLWPRLSVILVSRDDLPLPELVHRHRGKQGFENGFKGPLVEMDLHHPPSRSLCGNQVYYLCGLIAQQLLCFVQFHLLDDDARGVGLRPLIRDVMRTVAKVTRSARRWGLRFAKTNHRLDWILHAVEAVDAESGRWVPG